MKAFEDITVSNSSIPSLIITVIMMIVIPAFFFVYWRKKYKQSTSIRWFIAGAVGFIVSARVLELGVHYFCIVADNPVSRFINANTAAYVLYGAIMAGVFEECGRYIILKYILKKDRTRENAVFYGIGHGGIEILTVLLPAMITYLVIAVLFSKGSVESTIETLNITEENAAAALASVQAAASFDYAVMALNVIERLLAMFMHIGFSVIVYYGVVNEKKICLLLAILAHILVDIFAGLYQRGVVSLLMAEIWTAFWTAVIVVIALKLYKRMNRKCL